MPEHTTARTQRRTYAVPPALERVHEAARRDKEMKFTALLHHITPELLGDRFHALNKRAAAGIDGVTWEGYAQGLEERLQDLHGRIHRGAYRTKPSRRTYIPKADGRLRPLGIAALEEKLTQGAVVEVLNAIYEADFLGFSYGFRPGRGQHDALDALCVGLTAMKVSWVLDADIRGFFDTIDHECLMQLVERRIADPRVLRLIRKWLTAGVMEEGSWHATEVGTPQGATISPLLANIYLHYVLDLWAQEWREKAARGDVILVRYADDFVVGFQHRDDAERFQEALQARLRQFHLELHPDKTRLIEFGRFAADNRRNRGESDPETFDFLGFTHICGRSRDGRFQVLRQSSRKRVSAKLKAVYVELKRRRHEGIPVLGLWLGRVLRGFYNYHAVPNNIMMPSRFRRVVLNLWVKVLRRRSQKHRLTWERIARLADRWLPRPRILHPWPAQRLHVIIQGRSPVR